MKKMFAVFLAVLTGVIAAPRSGCSADEHQIKEWVFREQYGDVVLSFEWVAPANPNWGKNIIVYPKDYNSRVNWGVSDSEMENFLRQALDDMKTSGVSMVSLESIVIWINLTQYEGDVNAAIERKMSWRKCLRRYSCHEASKIGSDFLNEAKTYSGLDKILGQYGFRRKGISLGDGAVGEVNGHPAIHAGIVIAVDEVK